MLIERVEELRLSRADEAQIAALLEAAFDTDFGGRSFFHQRMTLRLLARDDGRIVGHMGLLYRSVRLGEALVDIMGLADVATDPNRRGEGIAGRLLAEAITVARDSPAAFFLLFGDAPLYAGHGFEPQGNPLRYLHMDGAVSHGMRDSGPDGLMVLPLRDAAWDGSALLDLLGDKF